MAGALRRANQAVSLPHLFLKTPSQFVQLLCGLVYYVTMACIAGDYSAPSLSFDLNQPATSRVTASWWVLCNPCPPFSNITSR